MRSHVYFLNQHAVPSWASEDPPSLEARSVATRRRLADRILAALPGSRDTGFPREHVGWWIELEAPGMEIFVHEDYVHLHVRYRSVHEHEAMGLTDNLYRIADVVLRDAGYDVVQHGCQGVDRYVEIDTIALVLGGVLPSEYDLNHGGRR